MAYEVFDGGVYTRRLVDGRGYQIATDSFGSQGRSSAFNPAWQPRPPFR